MQTNLQAQATVVAAGDGLRLQSGPGRDLIFKVTGDETRGLLDYFIVEVAPHGGPPLHVHHTQEEAIHVVNGRFKVRIGDDEFELDDDEKAVVIDPNGAPRDDLVEAAANCPVMAITIRDAKTGEVVFP